MVFIRIVLILGILSGCQSLPDQRQGSEMGGAMIEDATKSRMEPGSQRAAGAESFSRQAPEVGQASAALQTLLLQARQELRQQQWWQAIEVAERGLRINRRESRFYAVLAAAYTGLGNSDRAHEFARQGWRHCHEMHQSCAVFKQYLDAK